MEMKKLIMLLAMVFTIALPLMAEAAQRNRHSSDARPFVGWRKESLEMRNERDI